MDFKNGEIIVFGILLVLLGVSIANVYDFSFKSFVSKEKNYLIFNVSSENDIISVCSNLSLFETSKCLVDSIKTFYKYKVTSDSLTITFEDLIKNGGDCRNYAFLYERLGKELNFTSTTYGLDLTGDGYSNHRFAILSEKDVGYCIIDQIDFKCMELG